MSTGLWTRRRFLQATGALGAGALLGGCTQGRTEQAEQLPTLPGGPYEGPPVEMSFWNGFTGGDGPVFLELVDRFNQEHPNITINMNTVRWREFYQVTPSAVAANAGPEIAVIGIDQVATFAARGVITPMDDVAEVLGLDESEFTENVWNAGVYRDRRYSIPLDVHPLGMYYNRALLDQAGLDPESPPTNREEYESALNALKDAGINGQWISPFPFTGMLMFMSLLPQFGGSLYNEEGTQATWDSEAGVEAVEWMLSLIEDGHSPADVGQDAETTAFQNGQAAFLWNGIWMVSAFAETPGLDWGVAPIPNIGGEPAVWSGSHNMVITNKGRQDPNKRHAAATFINWVSEESLAWAAAGQVPARTSVREDPGFAELEAQSNFAEQIDYLAFVPTIPGIPEAQIQLEQGYQQAALRLAPVQDALSSSAERATQLMESNVQRYEVQP